MGAVALVIARTEVRRSIRATRADRTKLLTLLALAGFLFLPGVAIGILLAFVGARALETGDLQGSGLSMTGAAIGAAVAFLWLGVAMLASIRTATQVADLDEPPFLLLGTTTRTAVVGLVVAEWVRFGVWLVPASIAIGAAGAAGLSHPAPGLLVPALVVLVGASAIPTGFLVGIVIRHAVTTYEPIARLRLPIVVVLGGTYLAALVTGWFGVVVRRLARALAASPLGWPGELLLLGIPGVAVDPRAIGGAFVATVALTPLLFVAAERVAGVHWYRDLPARTTHSHIRAGDRLEWLLAWVASRPVRAVCITAIRRTKRAPVRTLYVAYPLIGALFFLAEIVRTGEVPIAFVVGLCAYVAWGAGALFTLNPLGDLGAVVAGVLSAPIRGRDVMAGYALAAMVVGIPVAVVVALVTGSMSSLGALHIGLLVLGTAVATALAPVLALGVGTMFPRFASVRVTDKRRAVMPSKLSFLVYSSLFSIPATAAIVISVPGIATGVLAAFSALIGVPVPPSAAATSPLVRFALVVQLLAGVTVVPLSYRYAARRFDRFALA